MVMIFITLAAMYAAPLAHAGELWTAFFSHARPADTCGDLLAAPPPIFTERLRLRLMTEADRAAAASLLDEETVARQYLGDDFVGPEQAAEYLETYIAPGLTHWDESGGIRRHLGLVVDDPASGQFVGLATLQRMPAPDAHWLVGYAVAERVRRRGYGAEIVRGLRAVALEVDAAAVLEAWVYLGNFPSAQMLAGLGFAVEASIGPEAIWRWRAAGK